MKMACNMHRQKRTNELINFSNSDVGKNVRFNHKILSTQNSSKKK